MKRLIVLLAVFASLMVGGLAVGCYALGYFHDPFDEQPFSPAAWAAADARDRGRMARDAIRHVPPKTPKAHVLELLGKGGPVPGIDGSSVDGFGHRLEHPETWSYYLGCWSGIGPYAFDAAYLYVHFGTDGNVVAAEITGG